jgi:vancomycin resistance protein VanW
VKVWTPFHERNPIVLLLSRSCGMGRRTVTGSVEGVRGKRMPDITISTAPPSVADDRPASTGVTPASAPDQPWRIGLEELSDAERARVFPGARRRWTERLPVLYPLAVRYHRVLRRIEWKRSSTSYARERQTEDLPVRVERHRSLLLRQLGETEMWMQRNKVTNLRLACAQIDGLLIRPGETFSFNKLVGNATRRKGYVKGMRPSNGEARPGIGGGICQLANLLHWMVLHSPMTVTERSTHSFDPFPDSGRVLRWGVGCSIVYNYVDLQFRNDTDLTFQFRAGVGDRYLEGAILADAATKSSYRVFARGERFLRVGADYFRRNEIWRTVIDRRTGTALRDELIRENVALVKYVPIGVDVLDVVPAE